jgi:hypothetical protein
MKKIKRFEYSIDNGFMKGAFYALDEKQVRKYLRKLLGWKLYRQVRESIIIKEVE